MAAPQKSLDHSRATVPGDRAASTSGVKNHISAAFTTLFGTRGLARQTQIECNRGGL
jgi:hypothetical protein